MEKVWAELKKIEDEANDILSSAHNKSKEIKDLAQQESEKLKVSSKTYANQEAKQLYSSIINEVNHNRDIQLKANQIETEKLKFAAEKRIDKATSAIVKVVLGEEEH